MISEQVALNNSSAVKIISSVNYEQTINLHNSSGNNMFLGGSDVSTSNGYHLPNNTDVVVRVQQDNELWGLMATGSGEIHVLRPD
jgi:hypothetical protein|tara:strand:- start:276 stop:530 length:255 start_codon:yes stop_codon:yes gene_type:complete